MNEVLNSARISFATAREELTIRLKMRDGALLAYIAAIGTVIAFSYGFSSSENAKVLLSIPFLSLSYAFVVSQHNSVIASIIEFINLDLRTVFKKENAYATQFVSSESFIKHTPSSNWQRTFSHTTIIFFPSAFALIVSFNKDETLIYYIIWFTALLSSLVGVLQIFSAYKKRNRINSSIEYDQRDYINYINYPIHNSYIIIRHGNSLANQANIISSRLDNDIYALSDIGIEEVEHNIINGITLGLFKKPKNVIIYSSPFKRTIETASITKNILEATNEVLIEDKLRERFFGDFEGLKSINYKKVWKEDLKNTNHSSHNVESLFKVQKRLVELINYTEKKHQNKEIIFSCHGDISSVFKSIFEQKKLSSHRKGKTFKTGEIRRYQSLPKEKI